MFNFLQGAIIWLSRRVWLSLPLIVAVAGMMVTMTPMNLFGGWLPAPDIALIAVFFWAIFGPAFLPPWAVLLLGLSHDFTSGAPIGFWAVLYLLAYGFTLSQRVFFIGRTGLGAWVGFTIVAALTGASSWLLGSVVFMHWLPPTQIYLQAMMSIVFYWPMSKVFFFMRRALTTAREAL
jgi:rod shape-determining protein MreD